MDDKTKSLAIRKVIAIENILVTSGVAGFEITFHLNYRPAGDVSQYADRSCMGLNTINFFKKS